MVVIKLSFSMILGLCMTILLFFFMQGLINSGREPGVSQLSETLVDFVRIKEDITLARKERILKPPPPADIPPPMPKPRFDAPVVKDGWTMNNRIELDAHLGPGGPGMTFSDGEYLPIVKVQPVYPRVALQRGLVGWVLIEFTVSEIGTVISPFIVSNCAMIQFDTSPPPGECDDRPNRVFDSAALAAAKKFKYKPKVIDGMAVATAGVLNKITFELEDE